MVLSIVMMVDRKGKGDHSFTVTVGSRNGPGTAQTISFPGQTIDDAYTHYTFNYGTVEAKQAAECWYVEPLKACLPTPR
jgi:hypothetical protein